VIPHQTLFQHNLALCGPLSNMNSSSHKTWQTSLLFLKPRQIQNLKRKKCGGHGILCPPRLKKWGDTSPVSPTKLRPWSSQTKPTSAYSCEKPYANKFNNDWKYCFLERYLWCLRPKLNICAASCSDSKLEVIV